MPNWVYQSLTVEGNPESVIKLKNQLNTPFKRNHDQWNPETGNMEVKEYAYDNPIFSFWNVIKPTNMAVVNQVEKKIRMDQWDIVKFQLTVHCFIKRM